MSLDTETMNAFQETTITFPRPVSRDQFHSFLHYLQVREGLSVAYDAATLANVVITDRRTRAASGFQCVSYVDSGAIYFTGFEAETVPDAGWYEPATPEFWGQIRRIVQSHFRLDS